MAHSCRWRFPARPGGSSNSGTGRRAGRIRVTASLRNVSGSHPNAAGLGPGFDAALQVSSAIGSNLQKFRDVLGESSDSSSGEVSRGQGLEQPGGHPGASLPTCAWPPIELMVSLVFHTLPLCAQQPVGGKRASNEKACCDVIEYHSHYHSKSELPVGTPPPSALQQHLPRAAACSERRGCWNYCEERMLED
ncbi:hypothetical protein PAMA_020603 [Pampus argenteus]